MNTSANIHTVTRQDFLSDGDPKWCPGCGCYSVLRSLSKVFLELGIPREKLCTISGIGCTSRLPYYTKTFGFHTLHGRAPTVATGLKLVNPDLSVWMISGDGDALAIGGNHTMHLLRRNPDINMLLLNNQIYGLTKGQASPTSPRGLVTKSTPFGAVDNPVRPVNLALASGATFVARVTDRDSALMERVFMAAEQHRGTAFVEVLLNCITFNDGAYEAVTGKATRDDNSLRLEHGQPMRFGKDGCKGLVFENGVLTAINIEEHPEREADVVVHRTHGEDAGVVHQLALMEFPQMPYPLGIFRQVEAPVYDGD